MLGLRFCARAFSSCGKRGPLFIAVRGPLTMAASLVAEHRLQTRKLGNCGSRAQLLRGMWDPPRPGLKPVSPALAGRFSTTAPPGKPSFLNFYLLNLTTLPGRSYGMPWKCCSVSWLCAQQIMKEGVDYLQGDRERASAWGTLGLGPGRHGWLFPELD